MDGLQFDALAKAWSMTRPRRALLKGLAGGIAAGLLTGRAVKRAAAACTQYGRACGSDNECCSEHCLEGKCACRVGKTRCGDRCVDLLYNENHCGKCGTACGEGQACRNGVCGCAQYGTACKGDDTCCSKNCVEGTCACAVGKTRCGTRCVDLRSDESNCRECGRTCAPDARCRSGYCDCPNTCPDGQSPEQTTCECQPCASLADANRCDDSTPCPPGRICCGFAGGGQNWRCVVRTDCYWTCQSLLD
jgi:hypothetical protein